MEPEVVRGLLGWSNVRPGLEFYRWDEKVMPRHGTQWGDLLVNEIKQGRDMEGSTVVMAILPRFWNGDAEALEVILREAMEEA